MKSIRRPLNIPEKTVWDKSEWGAKRRLASDLLKINEKWTAWTV